MNTEITEKQPSNPNAFPSTWDSSYNAVIQTDSGMTLRDYFAAKAMQGSVVSDGPEFPKPELIAKWSYAVADAMLKARENV